MTESSANQSNPSHAADEHAQNNTATTSNTSMSNVLAHIATLEKRIEDLSGTNKDLSTQLEQKDTRIKALSEKTQEAMQSFAQTLLKKWVDACETKDPAVKTDFIEGVNHIIKNSDETNGVWQMMVAASSLHEMRSRVDGLYSDSTSRVDGVGHKRPAAEQLDRSNVQPNVESSSVWDDFASSLSRF